MRRLWPRAEDAETEILMNPNDELLERIGRYRKWVDEIERRIAAELDRPALDGTQPAKSPREAGPILTLVRGLIETRRKLAKWEMELHGNKEQSPGSPDVGKLTRAFDESR